MCIDKITECRQITKICEDAVKDFENDLKTAINTSKTANFSTNFFTAITDL